MEHSEKKKNKLLKVLKTVNQLKKKIFYSNILDDYFVEAFRDVHIDQVVKQLASSPHPSAILDLCDAVINDLTSDSPDDEEDSNGSEAENGSQEDNQDGGS